MSEFGYLERPYLVDDYLSVVALAAYGMQVTAVISATAAFGMQTRGVIFPGKAPYGEQTKGVIAGADPLGSETRGVITAAAPYGMQTRAVISATKPYGEQTRGVIAGQDPLGMQTKAVITPSASYGEQARGVIAGEDPLGSEVKGTVAAAAPYGMQVRASVTGKKPLGMQANAAAQGLDPIGMQVKAEIDNAKDPFGSQIARINYGLWCIGGYLVAPYLTYPYLTCVEGAQVGMETKGFIQNRLAPYGMQVKAQIVDHRTPKGMQTRGVISAVRPLGMQVHAFGKAVYGMQTTAVLYNITNLRILDQFPSRGLDGLSWTASSTAPGDFGANNLNTDIVEQQWRSAPGAVAGVTLTCDTQVSQVFPDTVALLNHNLTTSAFVTMEGSNDPGFSTIGVSFQIQMIKNFTSAYYIAPTLPTQGFRYWRIHLDDPTNTQSQLRIGTILFGASIIFQGDNITDHVVRYLTHFADKVPTEGFTDVMNDRALKAGVKVEFRNLQYSKGNYQQLDQLFQFARTSLKCLWIPDPRAPERFAVFAKLKQIPESEHNVISSADADYVNLNPDLDESL